MLALFAGFLGGDPSLDFGVGNVGWEVVGEPLANVGRWLEQVAGLLPSGWGGEGGRGRGAAVGGGGWRVAAAMRVGRGRAGDPSCGDVSGVVNRGRFMPKSRREA